MKIDMHFHVVGRGKDIDQVDDQVFFYPEDNNTLLTSVLYRLVEKYLGEAGADFDQSGTIDTDEYSPLQTAFDSPLPPSSVAPIMPENYHIPGPVFGW
jgi:hypothetical protein